MRPVGLTDLDDAVRAVLAGPKDRQVTTAQRIVAGAVLADRYRKRLGRRHPVWGDGTLSAAARTLPRVAESGRCDRTYRAALMLVVSALA